MGARLSLWEYVDGVLKNDRIVLGQAITLIESTRPRDQELALKMMENLMPATGKSKRIGITGVPGVGKSTFIEAFGLHLVNQQDNKVAVLAIDPTSKKTKGSILGDKTRMDKLAAHRNSFIRPSPSGSLLGGVAAATREAMLICEAAGFDIVIIETVGVGQSEITVKGLVDFFLLMMLSGAGDELQGIKRGILEMADLVAINKADGDNLPKAKRAMKQMEMVFHMLQPDGDQWIPRVLTCSALEKKGIEDTWKVIQEYFQKVDQGNRLAERRREQNVMWMHEYIRNQITEEFYLESNVQKRLKELEQKVSAGEISPMQGARQLIAQDK